MTGALTESAMRMSLEAEMPSSFRGNVNEPAGDHGRIPFLRKFRRIVLVRLDAVAARPR